MSARRYNACVSAPPITIDWKQILESAGSYPIEAFAFVRDGLSFTNARVLSQAHVGGMSQAASSHVSGQQLCLGLREFAIQQYGMLAPAVLRHWHVQRTEDFGRIVYAMIDAGLMSRTADDSFEDFDNVFDFSESFNAAQLARHLGEGEPPH